jgi:hypothetical protein
LTREALPLQWAQTQGNLGNAYRNRIRGDRADNLEKAIGANEAALTVLTREALPRAWADTQNNLALTYVDRIRGDRADNLEKASGAYEAALTVPTREALPRDHLGTGRSLGGALLQAREWRKAGLAHASARDAFLLLFGQGLNEAEARDLITQAGPLFAEATYAAAELGESEKALALASEGRARLMAVALKLQGLDLPADKRKRLDELRADIRSADRTVEATQGSERAAAAEKLSRVRQELLGLVKEADTSGGKPGSALAQARAIAGSGGAVVVPVVTKVGGKILILTNAVRPSGRSPPTEKPAWSPTSSLTVLDLPELTTGRLNALMRGDGKSGKTAG